MSVAVRAASLSLFAFLAGCASTTTTSVAKTHPGEFITYNCADNKQFTLRFNAETGTVRIRTLDGSAELTQEDRGLYRDPFGDWILQLADGDRTELIHKGKMSRTKCTGQEPKAEVAEPETAPASEPAPSAK